MKKNSIAQAILAIFIVTAFIWHCGHAIEVVRRAFEREYPGVAEQVRLVVIKSVDRLFADAEFGYLFCTFMG